MKRAVMLATALINLLILPGILVNSVRAQSVDVTPPESPVKLIFIHHSTGENWLADGYGNLGRRLAANNYFVSDTNYGWGPNSIGDRTDIINWREWFRSNRTPRYMEALLNESEQHSAYTRLSDDPGDENQIVMFKSCFPNSALAGSPNDPPDSTEDFTVGHAKFVYNDLLEYFRTRPDKLFIVITAPPLQDSTYADNARAFNNWLVYDWLTENNYALGNVAVFDFYNVLTHPRNHHGVRKGQIVHTSNGVNTLYYDSDGDDHPNVRGSRKATREFVPLLNLYYHRFLASQSMSASASTRDNDRDDDGVPDRIELQEGLNPDVKDNDIFNNARLFVMQQYRDFLKREGDPDEVASWTNRLLAGDTTYAGVVESHLWELGATNGENTVTLLYLGMLQRTPKAGELDDWTGFLDSGASVVGLIDSFLQSPEYYQRFLP
jgi:hypothetical protein